MNDERLRIYLDDHLALLTGEIELAERCRSENQKEPFASFLADLIAAVARQRTLAAEALSRLGGSESKLKQSAAWLSEKLGRLKFNDSLVTYSPLARVLELEGLSLTAMERIALWETLASASETRWAGLDFPASKREAEEQLARLCELRREAAVRAFFMSEAS